MRFDIPVVGTKTFKTMKRAKVSCLAVEAGKTILLEKEKPRNILNTRKCSQNDGRQNDR